MALSRATRSQVAMAASFAGGQMDSLWTVLTCLLLLMSSVEGALYPEDGPVLEFDELKFVSDVQDKEDVWMVAFYSTEKCNACQQMVPEYSKAAALLAGIVKVGAFDCTSNMLFCAKAGVRGFPAIKVFPWKRVKNPYTGAYYKEAPRDYVGQMKPKALYNFAAEALPTEFVDIVSSENESAEKFFSSHGELAKVLLFSTKGEVAPLYKGLSLRFRHRLQFAQASDKDRKLVSAYKVETFPTVLLLQGKENHTLYTGPLKAEPLAAFLEGFAKALPEEDKRAESLEKEELKAPHVERLDAKKFEKNVMKSEDLWMVAFVLDKDGSCKEFLEHWYDATLPSVGTARFGQVNATEDDDLMRLADQYHLKLSESSNCSKVLIFPFGLEKAENDPELYSSSISPGDISSTISKALPILSVHLPSPQAVEQFIGTSPEIPKMILVTAKRDVPDLWKALAARFHKQLAFGQVHESLEAVKGKLKVTRVPSVVLVAAVPGKAEFIVQPFTGPLKLPYLMAFCQQIVAQLSLQSGDLEGEHPEVIELADGAAFTEHCGQRIGLCVLGLLDGSKSDLEGHLLKLTEEAVRRQGQPFSFAWVDVVKRPSFGAKFGVRIRDLPSVVVLSPKKLRFAKLEEGQGLSGLAQLIDGVLSGRVQTTALQELPSLAAADGNAAAEEQVEPEAVVEEEFNLADIMSESVEGASVLVSKEERLKEVEKQLENEAKAKEEELKAAAEEEAAAKKRNKKKNNKKKKKAAAAKAEL